MSPLIAKQLVLWLVLLGPPLMTPFHMLLMPEMRRQKHKYITPDLYCLQPLQEAISFAGRSLDSGSEKKHFPRVLHALEIYRRLNNGSLVVPAQWVVPNDSLSWPRSLWGLALGRRVVDIRVGRSFAAPDEREQLDKLGFVWNPRDRSV